MTTIAGNIAASYTKKTAHQERLQISSHTSIGASGAIGTTTADDPGCTLTKNGGTGDYTYAFPTAPAGRIVGISVVSAAATVSNNVSVKTFDPTAGTLNFITNNPAGTATNPANGDVIHIHLDLDVRG